MVHNLQLCSIINALLSLVSKTQYLNIYPIDQTNIYSNRLNQYVSIESIPRIKQSIYVLSGYYCNYILT